MSPRSKCSCWLGEKGNKALVLFHSTLTENQERFCASVPPRTGGMQLLPRRAEERWKMSAEKYCCVIPSRNPLLCVNPKANNLSKNRPALVDVLPTLGPNLPLLNHVT